MGGWKKEGGEENLTNDTPPIPRSFGPPSYGTFSTPLGCLPCFSCTKSTTEQTRSSFGGVQNFSGGRSLVRFSGVWRRGEIGKGWDCNTWPRRPHSKHVWNIPSHSLLQTNHCTRNSRKNARVLRPMPASAKKKLLHELLRRQTAIAATLLAESTPILLLRIPKFSSPHTFPPPISWPKSLHPQSFFLTTLTTMTHKIITEPNFTIFELFSVIPVLRLPSRIISRLSKSW